MVIGELAKEQVVGLMNDAFNKEENTHDTYVDEQINRSFPAKGKDVEQLLEFIENESPFDEFCRETRDLKRGIMGCRNRILEMINNVTHEVELLNEYIEALELTYEKYIENGSSEKDNIH